MIHATSDFRLAHHMDRAEQDRDIVLITRQGSEPAAGLARLYRPAG
jgi:PHD/YefM family antitoxin component YafN of YafNO toxin-antitoxin module